MNSKNIKIIAYSIAIASFIVSIVLDYIAENHPNGNLDFYAKIALLVGVTCVLIRYIYVLIIYMTRKNKKI